jgi:hypothetical protein
MRGISPGFVNINTGFFGLQIRRALRHDEGLRKWIKHTTLDCHDWGCTTVKLKPNPAPVRSADLPPDRVQMSFLIVGRGHFTRAVCCVAYVALWHERDQLARPL